MVQTLLPLGVTKRGHAPIPREMSSIVNNSAITCVGNVTADPKLEYTTNGHAKLRFSVACNRSWKNGDEWEEETSFFNCVAWRFLAEDVAAVIEKGIGVIVVGRLEQRSWETAEGEKCPRPHPRSRPGPGTDNHEEPGGSSNA